MTSGAQGLGKSVCRGWRGLPGRWGGRCLGWFSVLSCLVMVYLVVKPSHVGVDVDVTKSYMEKLAFTRACLSDVKVIMMIYACTLGRVATLGSDGMGSYT
jgi:hypothetical protein